MEVAARRLIFCSTKLFPCIPVVPQLRSRNLGRELEILWERKLSFRKTFSLRKHSPSPPLKYGYCNLDKGDHLLFQHYTCTLYWGHPNFYRGFLGVCPHCWKISCTCFLFVHTAQILRRQGTRWCLKDMPQLWARSGEPLFSYIITPERAESVFPQWEGWGWLPASLGSSFTCCFKALGRSLNRLYEPDGHQSCRWKDLASSDTLIEGRMSHNWDTLYWSPQMRTKYNK